MFPPRAPFRSALAFRAAPLVAACLGLAAPAHAAQGWSDTYLGYRVGNRYTEPAIADPVHKDIFSLTHASGYKYGSQFLNVDLLLSDRHDPARNGGGAREIYAVYRHHLSPLALFGLDTGFGPVREIALTGGFNLGSKNTAFASRPQVLVFGPTLKFNTAGGFLDAGLWYRLEHNHNGIAGKDVRFDNTWMFNLAWAQPFQAGAVPAKFQGFADYIGAKGKDGFGIESEPETLLRTSVMFDLGRTFRLREKALYGGVGYEYWRNKFGNPPGRGTQTSAATLNLEWHF